MSSKKQYAEYKQAFQSVVDRLDTLSIRDVYEQETGWTLDRNKQGPCPFCGSGTRGTRNSDGAFTIYEAKNFAICYSCGKKTNAVGLIMHINRLDYKHAIHYIADAYFGERLENPYENIAYQSVRREFKPRVKPTKEEVKKEEEKRKKTYVFLRDLALKSDKKAAEAYLKSRGIKTEILPEKSFFEHPVYTHKEFGKLPAGVVFFDTQMQLLNKRFISDNELPKEVKKSFNMGVLRNSIYDKSFRKDKDSVFVTEGVINALSFYTIGESAIALFSTNNHPDRDSKFKRYFDGKKVVIAFDYDKAGLAAGEKLAKWVKQNFETKDVVIMLFPEGKDANNLLQDKKLKQHIHNTRNYTTTGKDSSWYKYYSYEKIEKEIELQYKARDAWEEWNNVPENYIPIEKIMFWADGYLHEYQSAEDWPIYLLSDGETKIVWHPKNGHTDIISQNGVFGLTVIETKLEKIRAERAAKEITDEKQDI